MTEQTKPKKEQPLKDEQFPGYPHYPDKEDIMNSNENERIEMDLDNVTRSHNHPLVPLDRQAELLPEEEPRIGIDEEDIILENVEDKASKITKEDLLILGEKDADFETGETRAGGDLDVPGSEDDDADELIGEEDEENNYYSIGGDNHDDLEEDKA